ncbi:MAG: ABC transporter permease [Acidobacteria bacterium]|nr:ABC transporter permease [Acidobacteriota bacterium]
MNDLRYATRTLLKSPAFTVVALLSLALGIGVNTTIFSVVNAVLLRPLPVAEPRELVEIYTATGLEEFPQSMFSYPDYVDLRDRNEVFSGVGAYALAEASLRHADEAPKIIFAEVVSANFFDVIGVEPTLGRAFTSEEGVTEGTHPVIVLGHGFWTAQLGADPDIIGREIFINTTPYTVIGVAPASYTGMLPAVTTQVWLPLMMSEDLSLIGIQDVQLFEIRESFEMCQAGVAHLRDTKLLKTRESAEEFQNRGVLLVDESCVGRNNNRQVEDENSSGLPKILLPDKSPESLEAWVPARIPWPTHPASLPLRVSA